LAGQISYAVTEGQNKADRSHLAELSKNDQLSALFRAVSKTVMPAVVEVRVTKRIRVGSSQAPDLEEFYRRFFGEDSPFRVPGEPRGRAPREFFSRGLGSGVIVDAQKGHVLTNYHVVGDADQVEVVLADNRKFEAEWVRSDPLSDLAIIKIKSDKLIEAPLGDSDKVEVGDWVLAIGAPRGLPQTVTAGIISAKGRKTDNSRMYQDFIQTDAAINRGNSGGPLVNMRGEVIAISNSIATYSGGNEGIGFAVPSNMARNIMKQLIEKGKVTRGYLGVRIQNVDGKLAESFRLPTTKGALIAEVSKDSPADKAELKSGDFIVAINGKEIGDVNELRNVVAEIAPGKAAKVEIYRDGKKMTVSVTIGALPEDAVAVFEQPRGAKAGEPFGLKVAQLTRELAERYGLDESVKGVVITEVEPGSDAAEQQGLAEGMIITHVGNKAVSSVEEFDREISSKEDKAGVRLRVLDRKGAGSFVFITPHRKD
jgi:serine protease Do